MALWLIAGLLAVVALQLWALLYRIAMCQRLLAVTANAAGRSAEASEAIQEYGPGHVAQAVWREQEALWVRNQAQG